MKINSRSAKIVPIRITGAHAQAVSSVRQSSVFLKADPELKSRPGSGPARSDPVRPGH
jgi:hypothetical protein